MAKGQTIRKTIDMPEKLSQEIDVYQEAYYHTTNSQAIIQLIHMGLKYAEKMEQQTLHPLFQDVNTGNEPDGPF